MSIDLMRGVLLSISERLRSHDRLNQCSDFPKNVTAIHDRIGTARPDQVVRYARHWTKLDAAIATCGYPAMVRYLEEVLKLTEPKPTAIAFMDPVTFGSEKPVEFFDELFENGGGENAKA